MGLLCKVHCINIGHQVKCMSCEYVWIYIIYIYVCICEVHCIISALFIHKVTVIEVPICIECMYYMQYYMYLYYMLMLYYILFILCCLKNLHGLQWACCYDIMFVLGLAMYRSRNCIVFCYV